VKQALFILFSAKKFFKTEIGKRIDEISHNRRVKLVN